MKIKFKKQFSFRELMQYIIENDITGRFTSDEGESFSVEKYGAFNFDDITYNNGEIYEIEVLEDVGLNEEFKNLTFVYNRDGKTLVDSFTETTINEVLYWREICMEDIKKIYVYVNGNFQLVWEREVDEQDN